MLGTGIISSRVARSLVRIHPAPATPFNTFPRLSKRMKTTGVIFDMDGTLTEEHAIDFKAMYDRIGIVKRGDDIITQVKEDVPPDLQERAFDIIRDEEMLGCERMMIKDDFYDCINFLADRKIRMAISTRNCREGTAAAAAKLLLRVIAHTCTNSNILYHLVASVHLA